MRLPDGKFYYEFNKVTFHFWSITFIVSPKILIFFGSEKRILVFWRKTDIFLRPFLL